jgi:hypothetical protein
MKGHDIQIKTGNILLGHIKLVPLLALCFLFPTQFCCNPAT